MSALFTRLAERHAMGHARTDLELISDLRASAASTFRPAAVLAAITERERPGFLMIHRPSNMRAHPGQIAFPGGKLDLDESPVDAALREAQEELGIDPGIVRIVGEGDLLRTGTGFEITPVIGVIPAELDLSPNPAEVAQWFEAPLDYVLDPANHEMKVGDFKGQKIPFWEIQWEEHRIWGATAGLIVNLSRRLSWHV